MKKSLQLLAIILASSVHQLNAQDSHFSQFFDAPLLRNPSLAGIFTGDVRVQTVFRSQWASVTVPYQIGSFNVELKHAVGSSNDFFTTGLQMVYDRAGTTNFTTVTALPAINYHKALSGDKTRYLSLGFMGGYVHRSIDRSKITTNNQFDGDGYNPSLNNGETFTDFNYGYLDGSVGLSYNSAFSSNENNTYFLGLAYHHFNRPKNSFYKNPQIELYPKWVASGGIKLAANETSYCTIQADYIKQGNYTELIAGVLYTYNLGITEETVDYAISFGGFLRWKDSFIPIVRLDYNPFSITFSYDANLSQLKTVSQGRGGAELSVTYIGFLKRNTTKNSVLCPRF